MKTFGLVIAFFLASATLNQITGYIFGKHWINIFALFVIPLVFMFSKNKQVSRAAKIAVIPGFLLLLFFIFAQTWVVF